jgi:replication factor C subunit 2/4
LELNASDERGIEIVRSKIKTFAQVAVSSVPGSSEYPNPPFKIIILDEADSMTRDAQSALRRTMELYSKVTRFCIICNYITKIIDPITSRCAKFRFKPLENSSIVERLNSIAVAENILVNGNIFEEICQSVKGDLRKAINVLQSARLLLDKNEEITLSHIRSVSGAVPLDLVMVFINETAFDRERTIESIQKSVKRILNEGYDINQFLQTLLTKFIDAEVDDRAKARVCAAIAKADRHLSDGADEYLNLMNVACALFCCST